MKFNRFSPGVLQPEKWESCYTIQKSSWGYDRTARTLARDFGHNNDHDHFAGSS